ncbi:MAG TPA: MerR family transcriptional regulator [Blastocatellia bacterium]|nr:MerR family transcriptional regulator [Blastocatellia bacterium]
MSLLTISDAARRAGVPASTIRYYEKVHVLPVPGRKGGQRRYDDTILYQLAVIQRARETGFTLDEIRELFFGFEDRNTPAGRRWREMAKRKLAELDALAEQIRTMQRLLRNLEGCNCDTLNECGRRLVGKECADSGSKPLRPKTLGVIR